MYFNIKVKTSASWFNVATHTSDFKRRLYSRLVNLSWDWRLGFFPIGQCYEAFFIGETFLVIPLEFSERWSKTDKTWEKYSWHHRAQMQILIWLLLNSSWRDSNPGFEPRCRVRPNRGFRAPLGYLMMLRMSCILKLCSPLYYDPFESLKPKTTESNLSKLTIETH